VDALGALAGRIVDDAGDPGAGAREVISKRAQAEETRHGSPASQRSANQALSEASQPAASMT